jgi:hypothetical protein
MGRAGPVKTKPTVYVETSVVSYYTARPSRDIFVLARQEITRQWWETARRQFQLVVSEVVVLEVNQGDPLAAGKRAEAIKYLSTNTLLTLAPARPSNPPVVIPADGGARWRAQKRGRFPTSFGSWWSL